MKIEEMAAYLRAYQQQCQRLELSHYTNTVASVSAFPGVFGMNFEKMMRTPPDKLAEEFLLQEERGGIVRDLMAGVAVDDSRMKELFGYTSSELAALRTQQEPVKKKIPDRLCVLCFDDSLKSQYEIARPILLKHGFNATFFLTEMLASERGPGFEDKDTYMTWEEIAQLEKDGFELGNHSLNHVPGAHLKGYAFNREQTIGMEQEFAAHGLKKPVTYAYPSGVCNREILEVARDCGYLWGRGNLEDDASRLRGMTYYDPHVDSPLAVCNFGDPDFYTAEFLRKRIENTPEGTIFGLTYHGVDPDRWPGSCNFEAQMQILKEMGCRVIAMRDMEEFIDPVKAYKYIHEE